MICPSSPVFHLLQYALLCFALTVIGLFRWIGTVILLPVWIRLHQLMESWSGRGQQSVKWGEHSAARSNNLIRQFYRGYVCRSCLLSPWGVIFVFFRHTWVSEKHLQTVFFTLFYKNVGFYHLSLQIEILIIYGEISSLFSGVLAACNILTSVLDIHLLSVAFNKPECSSLISDEQARG